MPAGVASARLAERAERFLRQLLHCGELRPGDDLPLDQIARHLDMSRQPVRDAANRLATDGLIEVRPQIGCRIARPIPAEVADFYRFFAAAEGVMSRLAAERRTSGDVVAISKALEEMSAQAQVDDKLTDRTEIIFGLNRRLYRAIHRGARSPLNASIAEGFWDRSDFYIHSAFPGQRMTSFFFSVSIQKGFRLLLEAIFSGDASRADLRMRHLIEKAGRATADAIRLAASNGR